MSVIFLDSSCRACKTPGLEEAVARINEELGEAVDGRADGWNVEFQAVGVAMDDRIGSGVEFLSGYGRFIRSWWGVDGVTLRLRSSYGGMDSQFQRFRSC